MSKVVLITGGNSGIGAAAAKALAAKGYEVIIACRNQEKAAKVAEEVKAAGRKIEVMKLDLGSFKSIRAFADAFKSKYNRLDVLVNNAGLSPIRKTMTEDGFEQQFGVNYLGHFLMTNLLLDLLKKSAPARVVNVSSMMHWLGSIKPEKFRGEGFYFSLTAYGQSKLANILFSNELARRYGKDGIVSNALHPGGVETDIYHELPKWLYALIKPTLISAEKGASTVVYLADDPAAANLTGKYLIKSKETGTSKKAQDVELAKKLWDDSLKLCGLAA